MSGGPVYAHRTSKDVTRRIFVDMLHQFDFNGILKKKYRYVGFGALEFVDFDLVHRHLGIDELVSIEKSPIDRFEANKPYRCIDVVHGNSTSALAELDWNKLNIVWLDYESTLNETVFDDVGYLCQKLLPGSVLAVTLNAHPGALEGRRDRLTESIGEHRVPGGTTNSTLGEWGWAAVQQRLLFSMIRNRLDKRPDGASWWQVLNLQYQDNAQMQLVAGVISTPVFQTTLDNSGLRDLDYYRPVGDALTVTVPYLTPHEQRILRNKLPRGSRWPQLKGVSQKTVQEYARFYRWIDAT